MDSNSIYWNNGKTTLDRQYTIPYNIDNYSSEGKGILVIYTYEYELEDIDISTVYKLTLDHIDNNNVRSSYMRKQYATDSFQTTTRKLGLSDLTFPKFFGKIIKISIRNIDTTIEDIAALDKEVYDVLYGELENYDNI